MMKQVIKQLKNQTKAVVNTQQLINNTPQYNFAGKKLGIGEATVALEEKITKIS